MRTASVRRIGASAVVIVWLAGCATAHFGPAAVPLRITTAVPDATVWIDDHLFGKVSDLSKGDKHLPEGFHRIEVRAPGYYSYFQEVDCKAGTPISIDAPLHALLD